MSIIEVSCCEGETVKVPASLLSMVLLACASAPGVARADSFLFTPTTGAAVTFSLDPAAANSVAGTIGFGYAGVATTSGGITDTHGEIQFFNTDYNYLFGLDIYITDHVSNLSSYFKGDKLYSGDVTNPTFLHGTFTLSAATVFGDTETGTLVIAPEGATVTPEPSSLILFGTGLAGIAGAARRRAKWSLSGS